MLNIVCFGDSITEAVEVEKSKRWTSILQSQLDEMSSGSYQVINKGIGGNTTAQGFDRFYDDVLPHLPGLLLVEFGFNDANVYDWTIEPRVSLGDFTRYLREFHRIAGNNQSPCVFILNHTIAEVEGMQGNGKRYNENLLSYDKAVIKLAKKLEAEVIDLPGMMKVKGLPVEEYVLDDKIHLSESGNKHYAQMIFDVIIENNFYQPLCIK